MKKSSSLSRRLLEGVFVGFGIGIGMTLTQMGFMLAQLIQNFFVGV